MEPGVTTCSWCMGLGGELEASVGSEERDLDCEPCSAAQRMEKTQRKRPRSRHKLAPGCRGESLRVCACILKGLLTLHLYHQSHPFSFFPLGMFFLVPPFPCEKSCVKTQVTEGARTDGQLSVTGTVSLQRRKQEPLANRSWMLCPPRPSPCEQQNGLLGTQASWPFT